MLLDLDPASPVPIYQQVVDGIRRLVAVGALRSGDQVPTVRDLAAQLRVNRNTVARAIQDLEAQGVVRTRVGQGTFIAAAAEEAAGASREGLLGEAIDRLITEARQLGVALQDLPEAVRRRVVEHSHRHGKGKR